MKRLCALILALVLAALCMVTAFAADGTPFADSRYYTCGEYSLHYRILRAEGQCKGRILMVHGFLCSTYAWRNMASQMASRGYECVLIDLPDFGYSTRETAQMQTIPREELLVSFMQSVAPTDEWILAGHSMGGGVCVNIAVRRGRRGSSHQRR